MPQQLVIEGPLIRAITPEGVEMGMPLASMFESLLNYGREAKSTVLPDGIKAVFERGPARIWVHEIPPCVRLLKWIAANSENQFGPGTRYRDVKIALPYVIVLAVFAPAERGRLTLSKACECFFRNQPLGSPDDELLFPALLNCSKFEPEEGNPLAWICTQHIDRGFDRERDVNRRLRLGFRALLSCLFDTGFNYSSEHHEASSWFTESQGVDPRIAAIEAWQEATAADPLFSVDVPWLPTGRTLAQVADRIFNNLGASWPAVNDARALARFVLNHGKEIDRSAEPEPGDEAQVGPMSQPELKLKPASKKKSLEQIIHELGIF